MKNFDSTRSSSKIKDDLEKLLPSYSTDLGHDLVRHFFEPCLSHATQYDRATGDFSSSFLSAGAVGFSDFFINGGEMRLITNGKFTESDYQALKSGTSIENILPDIIERELEYLAKLTRDALRRRHVEIFAWLLAEGRIRLKTAFVYNKSDPQNIDRSYGVFHSKIGIFYLNREIVSFIGGLNESQRALSHNSESFDPAYSWRGHTERIDKHIEQFETLWLDRSNYSKVLDFPDAAAQELISTYTPSRVPRKIPTGEFPDDVFPPENGSAEQQPDYELRDYQDDRVNEWFQNECRGVLSMATGTGKTFTAIAAALRWMKESHDEPHLILVSAPKTHLVEQWSAEIKKFSGVSPISSVTTKSWMESFGNWLVRASAGNSVSDLWIVTTNDCLKSHVIEGLSELASKEDIQVLLIGDEAHALGTSASITALEDIKTKITATLALTATPHRHFDDEGTARLFAFFGPQLEEYTLADAIADGWLCAYEYHLHVRNLTQSEFEEYKRLTSESKPYLLEQYGQMDFALLERAKILSNAQCKVDFLVDFLKEARKPHLLVYTSPGNLENVSKEVADAGYRRAQITYRTDIRDRMAILRRFSEGGYEALIAIECLDEGVDIPAAEHALFLASTTNPKQYIQRRGRILRKAPGKHCAKVYDVLVGPPTKDEWKIVFRREMERALEFAKDADNSSEALESLKAMDVYEEV